ncbi:MAG TPA: hypothetical protein VJN43_03030 [Bryobacteraceae bacterium]|nr:hypothetical protein [Bryobacteraceae bacterium]
MIIPVRDFIRNALAPGNRGRTVEMLALIPSTVFLGPLLLSGTLGMLLALIATVGSAHSGQPKFLMVRGILLLIAVLVVGCASLACLWILLVAGSSIRQNPHRRWSATVLLALGLADALYFLLADPGVRKAVVSDKSTLVLWVVILVIPMLIGIRHIFLLLRPVPPAVAARQVIGS